MRVVVLLSQKKIAIVVAAIHVLNAIWVTTNAAATDALLCSHDVAVDENGARS